MAMVADHRAMLDAYKAGRIFGYGQVFELCR